MNKSHSAIVFSFLVIAFAACRKSEENNFLSGTWRVTELKINRDTADAFRLFLPNYSSVGTRSKYELEFYKDNYVLATYTSSDTLLYTRQGEWELKTTSSMHLYVDKFINADFEVNKIDKDNYNLVSNKDSNYVEKLDTLVKLSFKLRRVPS